MKLIRDLRQSLREQIECNPGHNHRNQKMHDRHPLKQILFLFILIIGGVLFLQTGSTGQFSVVLGDALRTEKQFTRRTASGGGALRMEIAS